MANVDELAVQIKEVDSRSRSNTHRIDGLERRQEDMDKLVSAVAVMANEQGHMQDDVLEIKTDVKSIGGAVSALEQKPGKRWEAVAEKVLMILIGAVMSWLLVQLGLQ